MQRKRRKYAAPWESAGVYPWLRNDAAREAGAALLRHVLSLYAACKLSAKDLCILCHYIALSGTQGADFSKYALAPDQVGLGGPQLT